MGNLTTVNPRRVFTLVIFLSFCFVAFFFAYSFISKSARDVRRKTELNNIAIAIEASFDARGYVYGPINSSYFPNSKIPEDPQNETVQCNQRICHYCLKEKIGFCTFSDKVVDENSVKDKKSFIVCANLEGGNYFCVQSKRN